jgi:hypothetical protein
LTRGRLERDHLPALVAVDNGESPRHDGGDTVEEYGSFRAGTAVMLRINQRLTRAMQAVAESSFEDKLVLQMKRTAPRLGGGLADETLRLAARGGIRRAGAYGFTKKGPIRLFVESMLLLGSHFDTDPQYPVLTSQLQERGDQMLRAGRIHHEIITYQSVVLGHGGAKLRDALIRLIALTRSREDVEGGGADMLQALASSFPTKAAYVGSKALEGLVRHGRMEARSHGLHGGRSQWLLVTSMFTLGHGISRDWSYPGVQQALTDTSLGDPSARAERFESAALALLEQTLADVSKAPAR